MEEDYKNKIIENLEKINRIDILEYIDIIVSDIVKEQMEVNNGKQ